MFFNFFCSYSEALRLLCFTRNDKTLLKKHKFIHAYYYSCCPTKNASKSRFGPEGFCWNVFGLYKRFFGFDLNFSALISFDFAHKIFIIWLKPRHISKWLNCWMNILQFVEVLNLHHKWKHFWPVIYFIKRFLFLLEYKFSLWLISF